MNRLIPLLLLLLGAAQEPRVLDYASFAPQPADFKGATVADGKATLSSGAWGFLVAPEELSHAAIESSFTIAIHVVMNGH